MTDKERETPTWNPPEPPWNPEPQSLSIRATPDPEPVPEPEQETEPEPEVEETFPLDGEAVDAEVAEPSTESELVDAPGLMEYTVKCPTGITVNGKVYEGGPHAVDEDIYETLSTLDAPYQ